MSSPELPCNARRPQVTNLRYRTGNGHNALVVDLNVVTGTALQHTAAAGYKPALPGIGHNALVVDLKVVTESACKTRRSQFTSLRYRGMGTTLLQWN